MADKLEVLFSEEVITEKIRELGAIISKDMYS